METKRNKNALIVGIFISIALAILVLLVFTLGGEKQTFTRKFPVKALFTDISGLKEGNNVWFSGVKIGTVKTIRLESKSAVEVTLNIEESARRFLTRDACAKISSDGLLGNKLVIIYGGMESAGPVQNNDFLKVPVDSSNQDLMTTLDQSGKNILEITGNFKKISRQIAAGEGTIGKLVNDPSMATSLRQIISNFQNVSEKSEKAVGSLNAFAARLNAGSSPVNRMLADSSLYDSIKNMVAILQVSVEGTRGFIAKMNAFAENLKTAGDRFQDTDKIVGMLLNDRETATNLQTMLENLKSASRKLDEDLEALQHNILFRGYFRKKQKAGQ